MEPGALLRLAVPADARALAVIHVETWRVAYAGLIPDHVLAGLSIETRARGWVTRLLAPDSPDHCTFVVTQADARPRAGVDHPVARVVGFVSIGPARDLDAQENDGEVYALYLDHRDFGRGYGRALLAHAAGELARRGRREMTLWVLAGNARARRFYEAAGMVEDGGARDEEIGGAALAHVRYRRALTEG